MSDEQKHEIIDLYFDGELAKTDEIQLFELLSNDDSARNHFRNLILLRDTVKKTSNEFPVELEERILRTIGNSSQNSGSKMNLKKYFNVISYAAAVIFLFLSGYLFVKITNYQERLETISNQLYIQSKTIDMLYNSYDDIVVKATSNDQIVIKPNI
ncbi:MAG: hypothetical protein Fur0015_03420 [Ignavibacteriales bacterium]